MDTATVGTAISRHGLALLVLAQTAGRELRGRGQAQCLCGHGNNALCGGRAGKACCCWLIYGHAHSGSGRGLTHSGPGHAGHAHSGSSGHGHTHSGRGHDRNGHSNGPAEVMPLGLLLPASGNFTSPAVPAAGLSTGPSSAFSSAAGASSTGPHVSPTSAGNTSVFTAGPSAWCSSVFSSPAAASSPGSHMSLTSGPGCVERWWLAGNTSVSRLHAHPHFIPGHAGHGHFILAAGTATLTAGAGGKAALTAAAVPATGLSTSHPLIHEPNTATLWRSLRLAASSTASGAGTAVQGEQRRGRKCNLWRTCQGLCVMSCFMS
jgi:hypothetical protein